MPPLTPQDYVLLSPTQRRLLLVKHGAICVGTIRGDYYRQWLLKPFEMFMDFIQLVLDHDDTKLHRLSKAYMEK